MGLSRRARVNFGTECPKIPQPRQVTRSDVTKLPEVSTSFYGAGSSFGTRQKFDLFFGLPLWYTYRIFNQGGHLVLGQNFRDTVPA